MVYKVRVVCETEVGDGKGFHYYREEQEELEGSITCLEHPESNVRDFVIEEQV